MKIFSRIIPVVMAVVALSGTARANLLVNGGFQNSNNGYSEFLTPEGWTNIGPIDGIIANATFNTPSYNGFLYYNDLGGFADALPPAGAGIEQTVATVAGQQYSLTFGLSNENAAGYGPEQMALLLNGSSVASYPMTPDLNLPEFQLPWVTEIYDFTATGSSTTIAFTVTGSNLGGQDPLIAGADLEGGRVSSTPEPGTFVTLGTGLLALAGRRFRRSKR
jgi:PEP-CTERM motif